MSVRSSLTRSSQTVDGYVSSVLTLLARSHEKRTRTTRGPHQDSSYTLTRKPPPIAELPKQPPPLIPHPQALPKKSYTKTKKGTG